MIGMAEGYGRPVPQDLDHAMSVRNWFAQLDTWCVSIFFAGMNLKW
jgi:hypothetical protein